MSEETLETPTIEPMIEGENEKTKLQQEVVIKDAGPCKKHVKVTIDRGSIDARIEGKISGLMVETPAHVPGFRPGKAPRKIIERKFFKEVASEVKTEVLLASLEQLADEQLISPLSPPDLDPYAVEIPETGPMIYEFDIEVRPEFDLPDYKNLKLRRPIHSFGEAEIVKEGRRLLERYGQVVPKEGDAPAVDTDDFVVVDMVLENNGKELNRLTEIQLRVEPRVALNDCVIEDFAKKMVGAKAGDVRELEIVFSQDLVDPNLRGMKLTGKFTVKEIKMVRVPDLSMDILTEFGVRSAEQFHELVNVRLEQRLAYVQRQTVRAQVFTQLAGGKEWDLPQDLLERQARRTLQRKVIEMRSGGMSEDQILARRRVLENDAVRSTQAALKEHFVLQKVAELEKLEIEDSDIDSEIDRIADQNNESPRKVRARMEKDDLLEPLATELLERKALDLVLSTAVYEDYELTPAERTEGDASSAEASAAPVSENTENVGNG